MEKETIGFVLIGVKTEQFATFKENLSDKKKTNLTTALEFKIDQENKHIGVYSTFTFEQTKKAFIKVEISCHFAISPDSWQELLNGNKIIFPKSFIAHLTMLTVGTARGVLHCKTDGTEFNKFLLPTLNIEDLVTRDAEFVLN
jgi:hypothetical protein